MDILYVVSRPLQINTSASIRNRATIDGLLKLGHRVHLITTYPDKSHPNYDGAILDEDINATYLEIRGVQSLARIGRTFEFTKPFRRCLIRLMNQFAVYDNFKGIARHALEIGVCDDQYDLVISSSDPKSSHLFVAEMYENDVLRNTPWVQIWGDPFLSDITQANLFRFKVAQEERRLLKHAKRVVYVSALTLKEQTKMYPEYADKMVYEPIPYVERKVYPVESNRNKPLTFLYCGDYSSKIRNIKPLIEAIERSNHHLVICGSSDLKLSSTEKIKIYPRISFEETKELEACCDVLVHLSNLKGTQIPGKIYHYSGTNKLILFILDGQKEGIKHEFDNNRYIFCQNSAKGIARSIEQISLGLYDDTQFVVEDFSPKIVASRIVAGL